MSKSSVKEENAVFGDDQGRVAALTFIKLGSDSCSTPTLGSDSCSLPPPARLAVILRQPPYL